MAEYQGREQAYGMTMAGQLKAFLESVTMADDHMKDIAMHRLETLLDAENIKIEAVMSLLGIDPGLRYSASLPRMIASKLGPILVESGEIEGHMDVHASTFEDTKVEAKSDITGSGKAGWGPISVGVKIHAQTGLESERKRSSDYSAGIKWTIRVAQAEPPEMLMKICDALCRSYDAVNDINMELARARVDEIRNQAVNGDGSETNDDDVPSAYGTDDDDTDSDDDIL